MPPTDSHLKQGKAILRQSGALIDKPDSRKSQRVPHVTYRGPVARREIREKVDGGSYRCSASRAEGRRTAGRTEGFCRESCIRWAVTSIVRIKFADI